MNHAPRRARCSAPGKLMLFGEYAVLEGYPSLAMCLNRRIACEVAFVPGGDALEVASPGLFDAPLRVSMDELAQASAPVPQLSLLWPVLQAHAPRDAGLSVRFDADFPPTWGLGSSSASTLAAAAALRTLAGEDWAGRAIFTEVLAAQRNVQGAASGYDVATQLLGGFVAYEDSAEVQMRCVDPPPSVPLYWGVGWSRRKASTGEMIRIVRSRFPVGDEIYAEIGALARQGINLLSSGDARGLGAALNEGQRLLDSLGAVPADLAAVVGKLQECPGVLGARLSGAGGGDCVLILADHPGAASAASERVGLEPLALSPEKQGIKQEDLL